MSGLDYERAVLSAGPTGRDANVSMVWGKGRTLTHHLKTSAFSSRNYSNTQDESGSTTGTVLL